MYEEAWRAVEAVRQENRPGSMAASRPVRNGDSMVPAAQEQYIPDPQPGGSNDTRGWWQTSLTAAEFSGGVSSRDRAFVR